MSEMSSQAQKNLHVLVVYSRHPAVHMNRTTTGGGCHVWEAPCNRDQTGMGFLFNEDNVLELSARTDGSG
jgi:hypothetical protein